MADLRVLHGVKVVDADTPANSVSVSAAGNIAAEILVALPIGGNTIGAVNLAEHGELDDDPVAVNGAVLMAGLVFDDAAVVVVEEGDAGYQRMSLNRNAYGVIRDNAGAERGANVTAAFELNVIASAQPGIDLGDMDILSIIPGVGPTNLGKAESATHVTADTGVAVWGVRNDAETLLAADGEYIPFMMSSAGRVLVETQGGAGGTSETDDDPFVTGTTLYVPVGGIFDDVSPNDLEENDGGAVRMSTKREMYTNIRDGAGNERSANVTAAFEVNVIATAQPGIDLGDFDILSGPTGASALEMQGTAADGAAAVGNPVLMAGEEAGGNAQSLLVDSNGRLSVDINSGGGESLPTAPVRTHSSSTDTAAAATFDADGPESGGSTTKLAGFDAVASVPLKIEIQDVADGTGTTRSVMFAQAGECCQWRAPHRNYYSTAHPTNAGFDGWRLVLTNLDNENAADLYGTLYTED